MTEPTNLALGAILKTHGAVVSGRRSKVLAATLERFFPEEATSLLDVGCGDGRVSGSLRVRRPELKIEGVDVLVWPDVAIPVARYDGRTLPFADKSWDAVLLSDVLHHDTDPEAVLRECARVARKWIIIKDHVSSNAWDHWTLRLMDYVGNRGHGVGLEYNYWSMARWQECWKRLGFQVEEMERNLPLDPFPANLVLGRGLHCFVRLAVGA